MELDVSFLPNSLKKAKESGSLHYFTGRPCKYGHISIRFTSSHRCCKDRKLIRERLYTNKD